MPNQDLQRSGVHDLCRSPAVSPIILGIVLDFTNPGVPTNGLYTNWGWAFSVLGLGGLGAWLASIYYGRLQKQIT